MSNVFGEVAGWAQGHGVALAGPAFARFAQVDADECEVDAGFVVGGAPATGSDRLKRTELGGCMVAHATHTGPYESLPRTYDAIAQWMLEQGYVTAGPMWEEYASPRGAPPEETRTEVYWPVQKSPS